MPIYWMGISPVRALRNPSHLLGLGLLYCKHIGGSIAKVLIELREKHITGRRTSERIVDSHHSPAFLRNRIQYVGLTETTGDFDFVKLRPRFSQVVACRSGEGLVWIEGQWARCSAGMAFITPPDIPHAYHAIENVPWSLCWVIYTESDPRHRAIMAECTSMVQANPEPLATVVESLWRESIGEAEAATMDCWSELIHLYAQRILKPTWIDLRLEPLLHQVASNLAYAWTVDDLARCVNVSHEHLRRLCQMQFGRSPMRQVTYMRMRQAATLLTSTPGTVEAVAQRVGYDNPFAFSVAFKRHTHITPSEYRYQTTQRDAGTPRMLPEDPERES